MARREYRDPTGKLLGISQNVSDRIGKSPKLTLLVFFIFVGIWSLFHKPDAPSQPPAQRPSPYATAQPTPIADGPAAPSNASPTDSRPAAEPDAQPSEQSTEAVPLPVTPEPSLPTFVVTKPTSLYEIDGARAVAVRSLDIGTTVQGIDSATDGWEHVRLFADNNNPADEGYIPLWALSSGAQRPEPGANPP